MRGYNKKILVVDDEEVSRAVIRLNFEKLGCLVDLASTGEETLRLVQKNLYHLILLDIEMFDMDGLNVAKRLKEMESEIKNIPLIAVTVHTMGALKRRAKELGFKDYVVKPVTLAMCEKILRSL